MSGSVLWTILWLVFLDKWYIEIVREFDAINILNADLDDRDAHIEADVKIVKSAILLSYRVILRCYNRSDDLIMFFLFFYFQCTAKPHLKNVK